MIIVTFQTEQEFMRYAMRHYNNPSCGTLIEFLDDMNRFKYLKRLFNRYHECGELKERLLLNHLINIYNVFPEGFLSMLLYRIPKVHHRTLKSFLLFLGVLSARVEHPFDAVVPDENVLMILKKV